MERLEARQMLAGNVTAEIVDGDLIVTGDGLDNRIAITVGGLHPGVHGTNTADGNPTSVNGAATGSFNVDGLTGDVVVRMGAGRDFVSFEGNFPGAVVLEGGAGNDVFWSMGGLSTASELIINTGPGENRIEMSGRIMLPSWHRGNVQIGGSLIITGGDQRDVINIHQAWVANDSLINTGDGPDSMDARWIVAGNFAGVDSGPGDDEILASFRAKTISLRTGEGSGMLTLGWGTYASRDLGIIAGNGATVIDAINARVDGTTYVIGGHSNDYAKFNGCQLTELQVNMGNGSDRLDVTGSILDRIFADLGGDSDWLYMTSTAVNQQAALSGGAGFDMFSRAGNAFRRLVLGGFEFLN
jgi:hypothetical protein